MTGEQVSDVVAQLFETFDPHADARRCVDVLTSRVRQLTDEWSTDAPCATFAVLCTARNQVWRVGDPWVMIDGHVVPARNVGERAIAQQRADLLQHQLEAGESISWLRASDPGRAAVMPLLRELDDLRNAPDGSGFGAIDGTHVPDVYIEVIDVSGSVEVILATDGYPDPGPDLATSEARLRRRLASDPLMIANPPATKGVALDAMSFDDRAWARLRRT